MTAPSPQGVEWIETYWSEAPPALSPRCCYWVRRALSGWRPNRRISRMGYYEAACFYGVWIWELLQVVERAVSGVEGGATRPASVEQRNALLHAAGLPELPPVWQQWHRDRGIIP